MEPIQKADPSIYPKMRENALKIRLDNLPADSVHAILMDWDIGNGTVTVLAAADGTASIYLSSGGGFIGGSQKFPEIRDAALRAIQLAADLISQFKPTETTGLPGEGEIYFYLTTSAGVFRAVATEERLSDGSDPLADLGAIMQDIVSEYRSRFPDPA
ncbi:MAG: hypothetical protein WCA21_05975 [Terracidiphilus sp.]